MQVSHVKFTCQTTHIHLCTKRVYYYIKFKNHHCSITIKMHNIVPLIDADLLLVCPLVLHVRHLAQCPFCSPTPSSLSSFLPLHRVRHVFARNYFFVSVQNVCLPTCFSLHYTTPCPVWHLSPRCRCSSSSMLFRAMSSHTRTGRLYWYYMYHSIIVYVPDLSPPRQCQWPAS